MLVEKGGKRTSLYLQNVKATLEDNLADTHKTEHTLTYSPAIMLPSIYPEEFKTYVHINPAHKYL